MKALAYAINLILALILTSCASTTPIPEANKTFDQIVDAPNQNKEQIYNSTKVWIAETFKSAKAVIELDNKADGVIIGNGIISYPCDGFDCMTYSGWRVSFTMKVEIKDQKYRLTFSNIRLLTPGQPGVYPPGDNPIYAQKDMDRIKPALLKLASELATSITKNTTKADF